MRHLALLPALLSAAALLGACAPTASSADSASELRAGLRGPLKTGETWTIGGLDQNQNAISGRIKLTGDPLYRDRDRTWFYDAQGGYAVHYDGGDGATFAIWNTADPQRLMACYVFVPYNDGQRSYNGAGLAGTEDEIDAVFAKLRGSGTRLVGGNCTVTRS